MDGPYEEISDGAVTWRIDTSFVSSSWRCLWGDGCQGILEAPAPHLGHGCCSVGAEFDGEEEARTIGALASTLDPARFQFAEEAADGGIFKTAERTETRVVDGACIFLNRPGFAGGAGCALHLAALDAGESPIDWKPSVCWQLPIKVDWTRDEDGSETATVKAWERADWGPEGETMAWWCTEAPEAFTGDRPVLESLAPELEATFGRDVYVELRRRLGADELRT